MACVDGHRTTGRRVSPIEAGIGVHNRGETGTSTYLLQSGQSVTAIVQASTYIGLARVAEDMFSILWPRHEVSPS